MNSKGLTSNGLTKEQMKRISLDTFELSDNNKKTETVMSADQQFQGYSDPLHSDKTGKEELMREYDNYLNALDNLKNNKPDLLKRTFDDFHEKVENEFTKKMNEDMCRRLAEISNCVDIDVNVRLHESHTEQMLKVLGSEDYVFYKVLYMHWAREELEKKDIMLLTPCKLYIFQSLIKRKYDKIHTYSYYKKFCQ